MNDKKHIDRLFQEKLKNFEAAPDDSVWEAINNELHKEEKRDRKLIPLWWKFSGVAALLALLLTVGFQIFSDGNSSNINNTVVESEKQNLDKSQSIIEHSSEANSNKAKNLENSSKNDSKVASQDASNSGTLLNDVLNDSADYNATQHTSNQKINSHSNSDQNRIVNNRSKDSNLKNTSKISESSTLSSQKNSDSNNVIADVLKDAKKDVDENKINQQKETTEFDKLLKNSKNETKTVVADASQKMQDILVEVKAEEIKEEKSIEDAIAEANLEEEKNPTDSKLNRWNISPNVAPVYFNSLGKGSSLDEQFVNNQKDGEVTMSYGVGGSYAVNGRLKVRAGINKVNFGYNTNNVIAYNSIDPTSFSRGKISNVDENSNAQNITYLSSESLNRNSTPEIINTKAQGAINQRFGFIEVPMEIEYILINRKLGLNLIGGFSTLLVDKNEIYSVINGSELRIGEANNINTMSYSANFGLGINYNISQKIKVNLEPTFKYQINTFSNSAGDFQPYFIGVYTGLSYKF